MLNNHQMSHLTKAGLFLCFLLLITSCGKDEDYSAYFGGQVLNPKTNYVIFSKNDKVIDTLRLDKNNRFSIKFDSLTPGLYSFKHDPDYQYVYFEQNDSIMVSIDSDDFDNSVVFSGRGEEKNNFMMELSLMHEADREKSYSIYGYEYPKFKETIDSTYAKRKEFYNKRKAEIKWSDEFDFYAKSRVDLNYYTKKEYYPYVYARRTGKEIRAQLPKDFYNFRKSIDFNNPALIHYSPYLRYLSAMLNNMSIAEGKKAGSLTEAPYQNSMEKLEIADSVFTNEQVKNQVLNNIAFSYLLEDQNIDNNKKFLDRYMKLSTDDSDTNEIRRIGNAIQALKDGTELPEVKLVNRDSKTFDTDDVKNQTVIFFWTGCARAQLEDLYEKIKTLKQDNPKVDFIAVNVDEDNEWKKVLAQHDSADVLHLRAADFHELRDKWVITNINRTIVLNPGGTIKNAFANLSDIEFGEELK